MRINLTGREPKHRSIAFKIIANTLLAHEINKDLPSRDEAWLDFAISNSLEYEDVTERISKYFADQINCEYKIKYFSINIEYATRHIQEHGPIIRDLMLAGKRLTINLDFSQDILDLSPIEAILTEEEREQFYTKFRTQIGITRICIESPALDERETAFNPYFEDEVGEAVVVGEINYSEDVSEEFKAYFALQAAKDKIQPRHLSRDGLFVDPVAIINALQSHHEARASFDAGPPIYYVEEHAEEDFVYATGLPAANLLP